MTEPLTDEEFEKLKNDVDSPYYNRLKRLIATVESLKIERVESSVWLKYHLLKEENAKLKVAIEAARERIIKEME